MQKRKYTDDGRKTHHRFSCAHRTGMHDFRPGNLETETKINYIIFF